MSQEIIDEIEIMDNTRVIFDFLEKMGAKNFVESRHIDMFNGVFGAVIYIVDPHAWDTNFIGQYDSIGINFFKNPITGVLYWVLAEDSTIAYDMETTSKELFISSLVKERISLLKVTNIKSPINDHEREQLINLLDSMNMTNIELAMSLLKTLLDAD